MGVKFETNFIVGKTATITDLREEGFAGFFAGSGAGLPRFMNIPGENYIGILSSNEYLTRVNSWMPQIQKATRLLTLVKTWP